MCCIAAPDRGCCRWGELTKQVVFGVDGNGTVERVFPALGRGFAVSHTHWMRMRHGLVVEHWANRDDQGLAMQLGWIPPSPVCLLRCALATREARHSAQKASG